MVFKTLNEEIEFFEEIFSKKFTFLKKILGKTEDGKDAAPLNCNYGVTDKCDHILKKGFCIIDEWLANSLDSRSNLNLGPITNFKRDGSRVLGFNYFNDDIVTFTLGFKSFQNGEAILSHSVRCRESQRQVHRLRQNIIKLTMCIDKMRLQYPTVSNDLKRIFERIPFTVSCSEYWETSMPSKKCFFQKIWTVPNHPENSLTQREENKNAFDKLVIDGPFWSDLFWTDSTPYESSHCRSLSFLFVFDCGPASQPPPEGVRLFLNEKGEVVEEDVDSMFKPELVAKSDDRSEAATVSKKRERLASVRSSKKQKQSSYCNVSQRGNSFMGRIKFTNFQGKKCRPSISCSSEERAALFVDILKFCKGLVPVNFPEEFEMVSAANSFVIELRNRFREADESSDFRAFVDDCRIATETFVFASEEAASLEASNESDSESSDAESSDSESWVSDESTSSSEEDPEIVSQTDKTASSDDLMSVSSSEFGSSVVYVIRARLFKTSLCKADACGHMDVCYVGLSTENSKRIREARQGKHSSFTKCVPAGWVFHCDDNYSVEIVDTMGENEVGWNEFKVFMQLVHDTNEGARFVRGSAFCQKCFGEFHPMPSFEILYRAIGNLHYNGPRSGMKFS